MSGATETIRPGFTGWLAYLGASAAAWPGRYRGALRRRRRRTIGLTILAIVVVLYPLIGHYVLADFSRNIVPAAVPGRHGRHVHDDLRHHGHRPQHRGRVRGSARPRVRRVLRDRRLHGGVPRVAPLRGARHQPDVPRQRRAGRGRDPPAVLDHRGRRGHRGGDIRSTPRRTDPPAPRRLPGHRDPGLRRDRAAVLQEPLERHLLAQRRPDQHPARRTRTGPVASRGSTRSIRRTCRSSTSSSARVPGRLRRTSGCSCC